MAVVGPGNIGTHTAILGAMQGLSVVLVGRDKERTATALQRALDTTGAKLAPKAIEIRADMNAVEDADLIYEAIHERVDAKRDLYKQLEEIIGFDVPIASGTSTIAPADLGADMRHPDRVFVAHFVHPVTTVRLAEVLEPAHPNVAARATFEAWLRDMALEPLVLERAVPGFIVNRLQMALLREAISLVATGVADARDVDRVITTGLGPRWVATGPLASMDMIGLGILRDIASLLAPTLENGNVVDHVDEWIARGATGATAGEGFRSWADGEVARASAARRRSYDFAAELHTSGQHPNDDPA
jgi:3-hydroxybutyryl-CoA dehydrogenase